VSPELAALVKPKTWPLTSVTAPGPEPMLLLVKMPNELVATVKETGELVPAEVVTVSCAGAGGDGGGQDCDELSGCHVKERALRCCGTRGDLDGGAPECGGQGERSRLGQR